MSNVWSWFVIIGTVVTLLACFWLIVWTNRQRASDEEIKESEAHVWDEDVRELNNPLPMWWLYLFVITVVWGAGYLVWYPGMGGYEGVSGWSQEGQYDAEVAAAEAEYGPMFAAYGAMSVEELIQDEDALGIGFSLYQNYCSQCHGSTAQGARGFPNLADGEWQYGGTPAAIEHSINAGRVGVMPALGSTFANEEEIEAMVDYTLAMQDGMDTSSPSHVKYMQLCIACHGADGSGMEALGAPSLVDDVWLYGSSRTEVRKSIVEGRNGVMPAHANLIGPDRARILAAYVYSLSR
jgi:cytochrome c oxidase cbb3-type subunit 3